MLLIKKNKWDFFYTVIRNTHFGWKSCSFYSAFFFLIISVCNLHQNENWLLKFYKLNLKLSLNLFFFRKITIYNFFWLYIKYRTIKNNILPFTLSKPTLKIKKLAYFKGGFDKWYFKIQIFWKGGLWQKYKEQMYIIKDFFKHLEKI